MALCRMNEATKVEALRFALAIELGIEVRQDVVTWADRYLTDFGYSDELVEISLSDRDTLKSLCEKLRSIGKGEDEWRALRPLLVRIALILEESPSRVREVTRFFERLWISNGYEVPGDLRYIEGIDDDLYLTREGYFGSEKRFIEDLITKMKQTSLT